MKVSVVIPAYNAERYIEQCIKSCIIQEEVGQIIVVNDGSKDTTESLLRKIQLTDNRIVILHHQNYVNKGAGPSRNLGIKYATCDLINFLDADDFYYPNRFVNTIDYLKNNVIDGIFESIDVLQEAEFPYAYPLNKYHFDSMVTEAHALEAMIDSQQGTPILIGFTFKSRFLKDNHILCLDLKRAQELNILYEACIYGEIRLLSTSAVGCHRLHANNAILNSNQGKKDLVEFYKIWLHKIINHDLGTKVNRYFFIQFLHFRPILNKLNSRLIRNCLKIPIAIWTLIKHPNLIAKLL